MRRETNFVTKNRQSDSLGLKYAHKTVQMEYLIHFGNTLGGLFKF
jgi:hypothetical protein